MGGGVEYYFGYQLPENDLLGEDFRSRHESWRYCRIALEFFRRERIPVDCLTNVDELVGNLSHDNTRYCFAERGRLYLVYLPKGGAAELNLADAPGDYSLARFNPRAGGALPPATLARIQEADAILLGAMGLPEVRWPNGVGMTPQIDLREKLELYNGVRPIRLHHESHCPLKGFGGAGRPVDGVFPKNLRRDRARVSRRAGGPRLRRRHGAVPCPAPAHV